jgi:hypothetical protein
VECVVFVDKAPGTVSNGRGNIESRAGSEFSEGDCATITAVGHGWQFLDLRASGRPKLALQCLAAMGFSMVYLADQAPQKIAGAALNGLSSDEVG